MSVNPFQPPELDGIWVSEDSWDSELAQNFRSFYPESKFHKLDSAETTIPPAGGKMSPNQFQASKRELQIEAFRGQFFKRCPGSTQKKALACCNYHVLNLGQQCNFNCSYCYLQSYLNSPRMKYYSNIDAACAEIVEMAKAHPNQPFRVGTGEVIDSLSMDPITLFSRKLIKTFSEFPKWTLEFKTKSDHVEQFLQEAHAGNVVVSWSLNPQFIIEREEIGTASLVRRLAAAKLCRDRGFQVAFHLDPMIYFEGWQEHYASLVQAIKTHFTAEDINVISVGSLRLQPEQRRSMRARLGMQSLCLQAEMFGSEVGKLRYPEHIRKEMYKFVMDQFGKGWRIFFCMETPESWLAAFESTPMAVPGLRDLFRPLPKVEDNKDFRATF